MSDIHRQPRGVRPHSGDRDSAAGAGEDHGHGHHGHSHGWDHPRLRAKSHLQVHAPLATRPTTFWGKVKQFFWGFLFYEWYHELQHERAKYNDIMNLILFGELLGIPLMNSSIGLRLLPYALPDLPAWKHRQLEEHLPEEDAPHIH